MRAWCLLVGVLIGCDRLPELPPTPDSGPPVAPSDAALLKSRPYSALVPAGYSADKKWPLVIVLHGYGGTGDLTIGRLRLDELQGEVVMVAPSGVKDGQGIAAWHPGINHSPYWDVEYLKAIIHDVEATYAIDLGRVFVIGHSQGAHMAHRMGCDAASDVAAVISVAGQVTTSPSGCVPSQPVSVLQIHGDADESIGYYGDIQHDPPDPTVPSAHETIAVWARNDQCPGEIAATGKTLDLDSRLSGQETFVEAYASCPAGLGVELWTMRGVGHTPASTADFAPALYGFLTAHAR